MSGPPESPWNSREESSFTEGGLKTQKLKYLHQRGYGKTAWVDGKYFMDDSPSKHVANSTAQK